METREEARIVILTISRSSFKVLTLSTLWILWVPRTGSAFVLKQVEFSPIHRYPLSYWVR